MGILSTIIKKKLRLVDSSSKNDSVKLHPPEIQYPLGIHLNTTIKFDPTTFILSEDQLQIEDPNNSTSDWCVVAIGDFMLLGIRHYKFYLRNLEDSELILHIAQDKDINTDIKLYQIIDEIFPVIPDDWDIWINHKTGLIGCVDINLPDETVYYRSIHKGGAPRISPITILERIITDQFSYDVIHECMFYEREVNKDITEYLLVSKDLDDDGHMITICAGIKFLPAALTIL